MAKLLVACLLLLTAEAWEPGTFPMHNAGDKYENLHRFEVRIAGLADTLGKKYAIKEEGFDVECLYEASDLSKLVKKMLDLGGFCYKLLSEKPDAVKKQYVSLFELASEQYEFRTSSEGNYVDLDSILPVLELIARHHAPDYDGRVGEFCLLIPW